MEFEFTCDHVTWVTEHFNTIEEAEKYGKLIGATELFVKTKKHKYDKRKQE